MKLYIDMLARIKLNLAKGCYLMFMKMVNYYQNKIELKLNILMTKPKQD